MGLSGSTILVSGVHGFIAGHLIAALRDSFHDLRIVGLDLRDKPPPAGVEEFRRLDLLDASAVGNVLRDVRPRYIFHLAAVVYSRDWNDLYMGNVQTTLNLLEGMRTIEGEARLIMPGSAAECGKIEATDLPLSERQPPNPISPYGVAKVWQSTLATYAASTGLDVVIARMFNVIGRGAPEGLSIGAFASQLRKIRRGELPPRISVGNLRPRRDFIDGKDAGLGLAAVAEHGQRGETYNVCAGCSVSMQSVLDLMISRIGMPVEVAVDPERVKRADIDDIYGSYARLKQASGWTPRVSLEESVSQMMCDEEGC